jgi:hypothetical protein
LFSARTLRYIVVSESISDVLAAVASQGHDGPFHVYLRAVFVPMNTLSLVATGPGDSSKRLYPFRLTLVRSHYLTDVAAQNFLGSPAIHLLRCVVPGSEFQVLVYCQNRIMNLFEKPGMICEPLFGLLPFGNVL